MSLVHPAPPTDRDLLRRAGVRRARIKYHVATPHLWAWLTHVDSDDPVRRRLNRAFAPILLVFLTFACTLAFSYSNPVERWLMVATAFVMLIAFRENRRGSQSGASIVVWFGVAANAVVLEPSTYIPVDGVFKTPSLLIAVVACAALFVNARTALLACLAQTLLLALVGLVQGFPLPAIRSFLLFGGLELFAVTALLATGAGQFHRALRESVQANADLELRVAQRTAELAEANAQLAVAKSNLERRAELRLKEVTEVVHDARNQIGHIRAAAELIADQPRSGGPPSRVAERSQQIIAESLAAQQEMMDAMLEAAMLEAGALVLQQDIADLYEIVERACATARPRYDQHRCALDLAPGAPLPLLCDGRRVARVVRNLLHNALTYTSAYRAAGGSVCVTVTCEGDSAVIRVTDNGIGIEAEQLARLGQRFVRVAGDAAEGCGIGLNASMGIIALHGGTLRLSSPGLGQGTTAEVRLPLTPA